VRGGQVAPALGAACLLLLGACAGTRGGVPYEHNRSDYEAFRTRFPDLLEPNYLPFMATRARLGPAPARWARSLAHRLRLPVAEAREVLLFCRWEAGDFPLPVYVVPPAIPAELIQETPDRRPADYVAAVHGALALWEEGLEGLVRFRSVDRAADARLVLRLTAAPSEAEDPEVQVLGTTPLGRACRVGGGDPASGRLPAHFAVSQVEVRVRDEFGLLLPDQVERIALHEIGHALGMRTHSPIPADLMYPVVRDRLPRGELGTEDVNSFVSLYQIPNGTVYRVLPASPQPVPPPPLPTGPPQVELAPHVDARLGYEIQLPRGWTALDTGFGVVAVDGTTWDYEASFQVVVRRFASLDEYLDRYGSWHLGGGRILEARTDRVAGHRARRFGTERPDGRSEELVLIESGDGRVVVVIWDCPSEEREVFRPWFEASLATLELRAARGPERDRDYRAEPRP
jgi:Matrixin